MNLEGRVAVRTLERLVVLSARPNTQPGMLRDLDGRTDPYRLLAVLAKLVKDPRYVEGQRRIAQKVVQAQARRTERRRARGRRAQRRYLARLRKEGGARYEAYLADGRHRRKKWRQARRLDVRAAAGAPCRA